jgi:hypothetical protein
LDKTHLKRNATKFETRKWLEDLHADHSINVYNQMEQAGLEREMQRGKLEHKLGKKGRTTDLAPLPSRTPSPVMKIVEDLHADLLISVSNRTEREGLEREMQRGKLEQKLTMKRSITKPPPPPPPTPPSPPPPLTLSSQTEEGRLAKPKKTRKTEGTTAKVKQGQLPPRKTKSSLLALNNGANEQGLPPRQVISSLAPLSNGAKPSLPSLEYGANSLLPALNQLESKSSFLVSIEATDDNAKQAESISGDGEGAKIVRVGTATLPAVATSLIEEGLNHRTLTTKRTNSMTLVGTVRSDGTWKTKWRWFCCGHRALGDAEQQAIAAVMTTPVPTEVPTEVPTKEEGLDKALTETIRDRVRRSPCNTIYSHCTHTVLKLF